jgi:predicted RNA binding protein YcfA (HicA-like mRNA interferase family)
MGEKRPRLVAREVTRILSNHGFLLVSTRGSHEKWRHPETRKQVIVPQHRGKVLPIGTLLSIIKGSGLPDEAWKE